MTMDGEDCYQYFIIKKDDFVDFHQEKTPPGEYLLSAYHPRRCVSVHCLGLFSGEEKVADLGMVSVAPKIIYIMPIFK